MRALRFALALPLLLAATSAQAASPVAADTRPDLVLVTLDTTRADHLGAWGWPHARTPHLDALARNGTRFVRCDTAAPVTLPSHASILTGLLPPGHGVRDNGTFVLSTGVETLAERLRTAGYDTAAFVSAVVLARRHGLDQGFRIYDDDLGAGYAAATEVGERDAEAVTSRALAALPGLKHPFFLWVHYFDPHEEYRPPTRFTDLPGPTRLYDGEIAFVDEQLGRLIAALPPTATVAVSGDHGEMLGEHGEATHGLLPFAGARRVPLILSGPGIPAAVDNCLVRTVDIAPTLLARAGVAVPAKLDGLSLLPLPSRGGSCRRESYTESFLPFFSYKWYPLRALSDGDWLFLQAPQPSLFRLDTPQGEAIDLAARQSAAVADWSKRLVATLAAHGETLDATLHAENVLTAEQRAQLQSLGYLAGGGGRVSADLPDPRTMTDVAQRLHEIHGEVQQGRCRDVLRELQAIVKRDPHDFPALNLAGFCLKEIGRTADAIPLFERASRENELSAVPVANLAGAMLELGRRDEAVREYRRALTLDPTQAESASNLARLLREKGETRQALAVLETARAAGSLAPVVTLERGMAKAELGDLAGALADFREAARRDPANPVPLENAARAAFQLGQARAAAQLYEQLLRLTPSRGDLWKTLGAIRLETLEDKPAALAAFRQALALETEAGERTKLQALIDELAR